MRVTRLLLSGAVVIAAAVSLSAQQMPPTPNRQAGDGEGPFDRLVIRGITVIDGTGAPPRPNAAIVIEGDRIRAVGPAAGVQIPPGAEMVDASGKWIIPGLIDAHVHLGQSGGLYTRPDIIDLRSIRP